MNDTEEHYLKKELQDLMQSDPAILEFLQTGALDGIWYRDLESPENEWFNPRFWEILGYSPEEKSHRASEWRALIHPDDLAAIDFDVEMHCRDPSHHLDQIVRYRHRLGHTVWTRCRGIAIRDADGHPLRMLGTQSDVTELKQAEEALRQRAEELEALHAEQRVANEMILAQTKALEKLNEGLRELATHDPLTGLCNRAAFQEHVEWMIADARRRGERISMLAIDLDHFKDINDQYGHGEGDAALQAVASVLLGIARESDMAARYGGEEFALALGDADEAMSITVAERIRAAIAGIAHLRTRITASVGIATIAPGTTQADAAQLFTEAMLLADRALYAGKREGRNCVRHVTTLASRDM